MSMSSTVEKYLQNEPKFRERKNKDRGIVILLILRYPTLRNMGKNTLTAVMQDYASMDRAWRKLLQENEYLRGKDYNEKEVLEQKKQIELGYTPGHHQDVKKLKTLF